jgi:rhodanese-related sulfurtransferase
VKPIDPDTLRSLLTGARAPVILDVRLEDDFAAGHIAGAINNCVFEVAFAERMAAAVPDKSAPVVVAGWHGDSREAETAAEKLARLGYGDVRILAGGMAAWTAAGGAIDGSGIPPAEPSPADGEYGIDCGLSRIGWRGRNLLNGHHGTVAIRSGRLIMRNGLPASGGFVIDLNAIHCDDLAGGELHDVLIAHLRSDDFFDADRYPEARVDIVKAEPVAGACRGSPNVRIHADLTLRGVTAPVIIDAAAGATGDGRLAAQATVALDRTRWHVIYGSGRFFHRLAGHLVNDLIDIDVKVVTNPTGN